MKKTKKQRTTPMTAMLGVGILTAATGAGVWLNGSGHVSAACNPPATSYGTATYSVNVPTAGDYRIWSRIMAPDTTNNAYLLEVDGASCYTVGNTAIQAGKWTWVDYQNASSASKITINLTAGTHKIKLLGNEASVKVDRVLAATDTACVPTDTGDNCAVASDATTPTVTLTAPAEGASVTGTVNVAATATDDKAVSKVEFYVNNTLQSTDTTAPYSYSWNTAGLANGSYTVAAKAYDASGNVATDTSTVSVKNGDTQAPTVPSGLTATVSSATKVTVVWKASTDNTAVSGYTIARNGIVVGNVSATSALSYADATVLPGTAYSYKVAAYDAGGNTSAYTAAVSVTTPMLTDTKAPTSPTNLTATAVGSVQANLNWQASTDDTGVASYDIYRSTVGGTVTKVGSVTGLQYGDSSLKSDTTYTYYVIAKDAAGNASVQSDTVNVTTGTVTPPAQQTTGVIRGKVISNKKKAIAGVAVTARMGGKTYQATSNTDGVYRFENLPAGRYDLHWEVKGYEDADERLRVHSGQDLVWNMDLVQINSHTSWWNRWWR